jgi:DNA-binding beta-propeller fold protein YncE
MSVLRFVIYAILTSASAQTPDTARAAAFRALLHDTPALPLEQVPLYSRMKDSSSLGTVSSVAADRNGVVYVLQRGDKADPIIAVNGDGKVLRSWGKGMFTVPHSIRIDADGNVWTVDAGSSVILKFSPEGKKLQEIDVGEVATGAQCAFPTLCGTTDIAFAPGGRMFISDGYGNARILEYSAEGQRVRAWGSSGTAPGQFQIPHGVAVNGSILFVADRTNARIQRFNLEGAYVGEWIHLGRPFALKMANGALWVATMTLESNGQTPRAAPWLLKVDPSSGKTLGQIEFPGPHSVEVTETGEAFGNGCCGGINPNGFFWLRAK